MANEYKRQALEERLQILDVLEGLIARAPDGDYYEEMLSDFRLSISSNNMLAHLDEITKGNVATFILPAGLNQWTFWDSPVRIRNINPERLQTMQDSVREQLADITGADSAYSTNDITENEDADSNGHTPRPRQDSISYTDSQEIPLPTIKNDASRNDLIPIGIAALAPIVGVGAYFATPGSPLAVGIGCGLIAIVGIIANRLFGSRQGSIAVTTAVVVAVAAASSGAAIVWQLKHSANTPHGQPAITIQAPQGGDEISRTPVITGTVANLAPNEVVWSFNEPYSVGKSPVLSGTIYPDAGPCGVSGASFRCNLVFAGVARDHCRQIRLWVAVLNSNQANSDANIKAGLTGNPYISVVEDGTPPHVGSAIAYVHVQRHPGPKAC